MKILFILLFFTNSLLVSAKDYRVAALYWSMDIEGQVAMRKGVEERAKHLNKTTKDKISIEAYVAGNGREGAKRQIKQFYKVLHDRSPVDLIIIQPTDNSALIGPLQMANKLKIPVIAYDQYILGGELTSFITSNNYQAGKLNGEYIESLFPNDYEIKLVIVEYPRVTSTIERVEGFIDALKKAGQNYKIIKTYTAVEPVGGKLVGEEILKDFPKEKSIDVVFTINDGGGLPIVEVLSKAKRNEIKVATIDGDPVSIQNILKNNLTVINSAQFCSQIGRESMQAGYDFLKGKKIAKRMLIPTFPVTATTLKYFTGWEDNIPKRISLPWNKNKWNNKVQRID
ncbi:sugar ABC transporter substrate-binding protein [Halobacteriovorax sp. JY17]|uniref:sugar ABC transporter substrate-binding protein n=1 Tax=Halobacteriovorax sp. JY17 TaxID=2014617 RepID=UPI000C46D228|nr:sugar ABC transporter substrate-binding protein [Halobacteriovorax sp. JY17]PIK15181.1 MAG: sugar ABC transporter substrate-binding protein [Halobacteriovorax sp. JY17]